MPTWRGPETLDIMSRTSVMQPIWSTNNAISLGQRSSLPGRQLNPPTCDISARRDSQSRSTPALNTPHHHAHTPFNFSTRVKPFGWRTWWNVRDCLMQSALCSVEHWRLWCFLSHRPRRVTVTHLHNSENIHTTRVCVCVIPMHQHAHTRTLFACSAFKYAAPPNAPCLTLISHRFHLCPFHLWTSKPGPQKKKKKRRENLFWLRQTISFHQAVLWITWKLLWWKTDRQARGLTFSFQM